MSHKKFWPVTFQSWVLGNRVQRRKAKQDIKKGIEPATQHRTGRHWND